MNITLKSEEFLSLPIYDNTANLSVYLTLVLLADPSGEVVVSRSEIATRLNLPVVVVDIAIAHLCQAKLLTYTNTVFQLTANKAWDLQQSRLRTPRRPRSTRPTTASAADGSAVGTQPGSAAAASPSVTEASASGASPATVPAASAEGLAARIENFVTLAHKEYATWLQKHPDADFPESELEAFIRYWTEHNDGGRTFRREQQKTWQFQSRLTTWQSNYAKSGKPRNTEKQLLDQNEKLYLEEREQAERKRREEWASRPKNGSGLEQYKEELRRAVEGDEELRRKYPTWQESAKRLL